MNQPDFAYVIYIRATCEEVWNGLLQPEFTRQYWFHDNVSDWKVGSMWEHRRSDDSGIIDIAGKVIESELHKKLVLSWSRPDDIDKPVRTSRVTVQVSDQGWPGGPWTAVTLEHADLQDDTEMLDGVSSGWPMVFSGLKTLLEAGLRESMVMPDDL